MNNIRLRLIVMNFLEFAIWGAYLISLGNFLVNEGLGPKIYLFYTVQGLVSLFMPALVGIVADRWVPAQRMLSGCQVLAGVFMMAASFYCLMAETVSFAPLFTLYAFSVAFYMPTIGLANSVAYSSLTRYGYDTVKTFPPIRVFGTVGFIVAMLMVNFISIDGVQMQSSPLQLMLSGAFSIFLAVYALTLPNCPVSKTSGGNFSISEVLGLKSFSLFKDRKLAIFFIFSFFLGVSLQITNSYGNSFISSFQNVAEYADSWGAKNANALISLSQISETFCILLIPFFLKRFGIKAVMLMSMFAWFFRFGFFGIGNPSDGVALFIMSMIVYGIAFDFFNVSGSLYVDMQTDASMRSSAQGLFMVMTNGLGATAGTLAAGWVVNNLVFTQPEGIAQIEGWHTSWLIFAGYALLVGILFWIIFPSVRNSRHKLSVDETFELEADAEVSIAKEIEHKK